MYFFKENTLKLYHVDFVKSFVRIKNDKKYISIYILFSINHHNLTKYGENMVILMYLCY